MLRVEGLHVSYGATHAVRGIDLSIEVGAPLALLGANGAGKTSTLRAISQLERSTGKLVFDGDDLRSLTPHEVARRGLIQVPEGRHIFADLTVHENIIMGSAAARGRKPAFGVDEVYDLFPALTPLRDRLGYALSGGEQQMVAVGRALVGAPKMLLVDEPSLGLAPLVADAVVVALAEVATTTAMLLVEQNVHLALRVCPRAVVLAAGEIVLEASAAELHDRDGLLASYLGQERTGAGA